ncbi:hypothetical protein [Streptomyces macrosporus]|uniref:Uncharacterized protein n=1 Tax=Streptomyces macrosporus TaxID=44032 RepID=A0ABN3K3N3_9ACTN
MTPEELITVADEIEHLDPGDLTRLADALDTLRVDDPNPGLDLLADLIAVCFDVQAGAA